MTHTESLPIYTDGDHDVFTLCLYQNPTAYPAPTQDGRYSLLKWWDDPTPVCLETDGEWRIDPPQVGLFSWPELDVLDGYEAKGGRWVHLVRLDTFTGPSACSQIANAQEAEAFLHTLYHVSYFEESDWQVRLDCSGVTVNAEWLDCVQSQLQEEWPHLAERFEFCNLTFPQGVVTA